MFTILMKSTDDKCTVTAEIVAEGREEYVTAHTTQAIGRQSKEVGGVR